MEVSTTIQPPVGTYPTSARGEVLVTVVPGQSPFALRFSLAVLHDYTRVTGQNLSDIGAAMGEDLLGTIGQLLTCAVRRYVPGAQLPASFELADGLDLMETLSPQEADAVATAIWAAIRVEQNPLLQALIAKAPKASVPSENGASTSTSLTAS